MEIYVVKPGDSVYKIANQFGVSEESILLNNGLASSVQLVPGQTLVILYPQQTYTVQPGQTLEAVAAAAGVSVNQLLRNNPVLKGKSTIYPGQTLVISYTQPKEGTLAVNGYTYTNIDRDILRRTLPYLTYMTVFTYGFKPTGELIIPDDEEIVALAHEYGVAPVMLISTLTDQGGFSNELSSLLLNDEQLQDKVIDNILVNMKAKNYAGLDIDFEYVYPEEREKYVAFVEKATKRLNDEGYFVIVALAPKTNAEQKGLLYEAHDYKGLGAAANYVLLMTYEWGFSQGPPMAVAPIFKVDEVLKYAVTEIPREKIFMGMPNYGYDWTLPFIKGVTKAPSIGNLQAVELAQKVGATIQYDEKSQAPFFNYYDENWKEHEVWFEDARSVRAKLNLANSYQLNGVSYWNLMRFFPQNWLVLNSLYNIEKLNVK